MSDEDRDYLAVEGALFGIEFFFMCSDGHMHTAAVKFEGLKPEALTEEALTKLRDDVMGLETNAGHTLRPATQAEVTRYMMQEQYAEEVEKTPPEGKKDYFMMAGPKEAQ